MTALRPNDREQKVLDGLCLGTIEAPTSFPGVGPQTFAQMIDKGWIEEARDDLYGVDGYRMTTLGETIYAKIHARS